MKAVATVLVLIVGAAVVLWYGNTLNSWVLGGLIGGFGALLLSIPISLVLFSWISRHYDKHLQEEVLEDEEITLAQHGSYTIVQDQSVYDDEYFDYQDQEFYSEYDEEGVYEGELDVDQDGYLPPDRSVWEEEQPRRVPPARHLPSPSSTHLPAVNQDPPSQVQRDNYGADLERQSVRRRKSGSRPVKSPGSPGYQTAPSYSRYRSQALHAARMEAALQAEYTEERIFPSTRITGQEQMQHSSQASPPQNKGGRSRSSRDLGQSSIDDYSQRPRRIVDSLPPQGSSRRPLSAPDDAHQADRFARYRDTQYDMNEPTTDNLRRPLIRRAPYTYDDDPLREEMAQYAQRPMIRRSSRYLKPPSADDTH
jgi:hypothetical protein